MGSKDAGLQILSVFGKAGWAWPGGAPTLELLARTDSFVHSARLSDIITFCVCHHVKRVGKHWCKCRGGGSYVGP